MGVREQGIEWLGIETAPDTSAAAAPLADAPPERVDGWQTGDRIDRYVLREVIGAGGMGVVWSARDRDLHRDVAIKLIRSSAWPRADRRHRLLAEARAMARLSHPNVVIVHDVGTADGSLFVAMERVPGGTLGDWLRAGPHPWREVVARFAAAGRGLAEAHRAGLVHRDFKPDNVLIGRDGAPRVSDFGLALPLDGDLDRREQDAAEPAVSQGGRLAGTMAYMAPEQRSGDRVTARSDQFSFCVALHEGLHGARPFDRAERADLAEGTQPNRRSRSKRAGKLPERVRAAVARGLALEARDRWPSMDALVAELERCLRRPRRRAWLAAAGLCGLAAALAISLRSPSTPPSAQSSTPPADPLNLTFEAARPGEPDQPAGWSTEGASDDAALDAIAHSGQRSLRLRVHAPGGMALATTSIPAGDYAGKMVRLTGWLRTAGVPPRAAKLWLRADPPKDRAADLSDHAAPAGGTIEWSRYTTDRWIPRDAGRIELGAIVTGGGALWVDDLELTVLGPPPVPRQLGAVPHRGMDDLELSPDGEHLAYSMRDEVQVLALTSGEIRSMPVPPGPAQFLVSGWYPDGVRLLVVRRPAPADARGQSRDAATAAEPAELWALSREGAAPLLVSREVLCAAAAPDGGRLLLGRKSGLFVLEGGRERQIHATDHHIVSVVWSPDGERIAALTHGEKGWSVLLMAADGSRPRTAVAEEQAASQFGVASLVWLDDRGLVYASADSPTGSGLWAIPVDPQTGEPGHPTLVAAIEGGTVANMSSSADGSRLVFSRFEAQQDVQVMRLGPGPPEPDRVTVSERDEWMVGWSADSAALYFGSGSHLYRRELGRSDVAFVRAVDRRVAIAPDRAHILELRPLGAERLEGPLVLLASPLAGGASERVGRFELEAADSLRIRCGANCLIGRQVGDERVFHRIDLEQGTLAEAARTSSPAGIEAGTGDWAVAHHSQQIALAVVDQLRLIDLPSGRETSVRPRHRCLYQKVAWALDDRSLYATCIGTPWAGQLVHIQLDGGARILRSDPSSWLSGPVVSPDGARIAFNARRYGRTTWMLEGLQERGDSPAR